MLDLRHHVYAAVHRHEFLCPTFPPCFFFHDTATPEIYTLSLHDALPIFAGRDTRTERANERGGRVTRAEADEDRKSTRLNSSHANISYAVSCLKKKTAPRAARLEAAASEPQAYRDHGVGAGTSAGRPHQA